MARVPRPNVNLTPKPLRKQSAPKSSEMEHANNPGHGIYHPEAPQRPSALSHGVGPYVKAYAIDGVMEFAFKFSMKTLGEPNSKTPGMTRVKTLTYKSQFEGTPHFVALNSFSGRFVKETGELVDRPLGAFEVSVWIREPGTLACAVRLSERTLTIRLR